MAFPHTRELGEPLGNPPLEPAEPDPRMMVVCEGCGLDIHIDCADMLGTDINPHFICYGNYDCMKEFAERYILIVEEVTP